MTTLSKGARAVVNGLRLVSEGGDAHAAYEMLKDSTAEETTEAWHYIEQQALLLDQIKKIGKRHKASSKETIGNLLTRAAAAGDKDAKLLIAAGALDQRMPS